MKIVGIDLATEARECGVCVLEEGAVTCVTRGRGTALRHPAWLFDYCSGAQVVAVDVPFGWPKPFADALRDYEIGVALDRDRQQYMYRSTDRWVRNELACLLPRDVEPPKPFAVAADKLGATAMVGTLLLGGLRDQVDQFDLSPSRNTSSPAVVEVYPALSLWAWALPHKGYKGTDEQARDNRQTLLWKLRKAFDIVICAQAKETLVDVEHCFDALVAALTGQEYVKGNTFDPPEDLDPDILRLEGWIRTPKCPLGRNS